MPRAAFTASFRNHFQPLDNIFATLAPAQPTANAHDVFVRVSELLDVWAERLSDLDSRPQHTAGLWCNTPAADTGSAAQAATISLSFGITATKPDGHPEGFDRLSPPEVPEPVDLDPLPVVPAAAPRPGLIETLDAADNAGTAYTLLVGETAQGTIGVNGDRDFYAVTLQAGQTYSFALVGTGVNNVVDPYLRLMDQSGTFELAFNDDGLPNNNSVFTYTPSATGTYYVSAGSFDDIGTGQYGVTVTQGTRPSFDIPMGAGAIDADRTWAAAPGTGVVVTYAFRATPAGYTVSGSNIASFTPLTATEITAVRAALQAWSDLSGITFVEVNPGGYSDNATMLFANYSDATDGAGAFAFFPGSTASTASAGDVWLNTNSIPTGSAILPGSYAYSAIMHEIGHAIGLSHPGNYNAGPGQTITYANNAQFTEDSDQYSLMSYFDEANTGAQFFGHPESPMLFDVYAVQQIYGANAATRAGDTTYGYNSNAGGIFDFATNTIAAFTIWDGGGIDTIDASGSTVDATIDLNEGRFSSINSAIS
ncbi:MAG: M10 family metallopeptidase C-terminal domain-containing protein, partial [Micropepsaceae bacterium]